MTTETLSLPCHPELTPIYHSTGEVLFAVRPRGARVAVSFLPDLNYRGIEGPYFFRSDDEVRSALEVAAKEGDVWEFHRVLKRASLDDWSGQDPD